MRNKLTKFLTSECPPKGMRLFAKTWKYAACMLLAFILGIGQMWGAETVLFSSFANTTASNYFKSYTVSEKTVTVSTPGNISSSSGDYYCGVMSGTPSNNNANYIELTVTGATIKSVSILITGNGSNKTCQPALLGWEGSIESNTTADYVLVPASQVISNKGVANAKWHQFDVHGNDLTRVRIYRAVKSVSVAGAAAQQYGNGQSLQFYGISVELEGLTPVCPSGLTISSKDNKIAFTEGDAIELTAALSAGNGDISYQWYKGSVAPANAISGATNAKYQVASCTTADAGDYFCVASKTSCDDAVNASAFAITVAADTKCFNMPAITSTPSNLAAVSVTGGTLADVGDGKTLKMQGTGIGFGNGNAARLKVTLTGASIVAGTKITIDYNNASSDGSGIGLYNGDYEHQVIATTGVKGDGTVSHTFTAEEAAYYADEFLIDRNNTGKGIIVGSIIVEDCGPAVTKHTITLKYNDGETADGSLTVVDGRAAAKPADPTRGKYTFLGWFVGDTDDEYVWSTAVTGDITLKAHWQDPWTITFDADGGSAVADVTVKHNTKAEKPADPTKDDNDFMGWFYGDPAVAFDWDANVTQNYALVAHWQAAVAKYDIEYYDGETKIGTEEQVWATAHPTAAGIETAKPLYTFVGWFTSSTLEGDPVALNTVTPIEGLKLYGKWAKAFATSYDMEAYAASAGADKDGLESELTAAGYAFTNVNGIDNGHTHNYIYDGMKYKTNDGDLSFNVNASKLVIVKTGNLPANALTMYINGVADPTVFVGANEAVETHVNNYFYSAVEALYRLDIQASKGTCAIKAVTITNPFTVSFDANGGDDVASLNGTPSVTLPLPTKGTESFLGWFDGETNVGMNGDKYTPTANITLVAHWEAVSTDARLASISFSSDAGTLSPAFNPEVTEYTYTMPYGTTAIPTIIGGTAVNANAQTPIIGDAAAAWGDAQTIKGVAQSNDKKTYTITMKVAPKDGVCLVWADVSADNTLTYNATNSKFYAESDVTLQNSNVKGKDGSAPSGKKFQNNGFLKIALNEGTFLAGDVVALNVTYGTANVMHVFKAQAATSTDVIGEATGNTDAGLNKVAITEDAATLWLVRGGDYGDWNPHVDYVAVYRAMNPVLTAITINGETGTINESAKTVAVELQPGYDLAALAINPTIVSNTAEADVVKTVTSNGGEWIIGANTYRLTDKDGDYTEYTVTLTAGELKHNVSFNTHGGSTIDPVQVVDGQKLAAAPADPTKEDYIFQGWAETEDGSIVDVTSFTISADKEFHAVWASDGAIKLLDGATVNHTNFITGVTADETVEFMGNTVNYAKFSGTVSGVNGVKDLTRVIAYNATTNKTKIRISAHNNSTSGRNILVKGLVEGADAATDLATIALGNKEDKVSDWIEFDNATNRTIYIMVPSSAGDVYFTQVKVIESGETPMKQAGETGYSLNFNKGRFFGVKDLTAHFEGLDVEVASSDCAPLNTEVVKLASTSMSFTVASAMTLSVTTNNNKTYYVTEGAAGTDNETAKTGVSEFNLTAGTWYITAGASNVEITNIAFSAPKCAEPVIDAQPASKLDFDPGDMTATVTAHATDGGTLKYQWYKAEDDSEVTGATGATLTTTSEGKYYVIVTNTLADHSNNFVKSDEATLKYRKADDATLSSLTVSAGTLAPAFDPEVLEYNVTLSEGTVDVPTLTATATMAAYGATADITNATAFVSYEATSTVLVTAEDHSTQQTYTVHFYVDHLIATLVDVTGSTTWDWTGSDDQTIDDVPNKGTILANYIEGDNFNKIEGKDNEYARRNQNGGVYQGTYLHFNTTVGGFVKFYFRAPSSGENCTITVKNNGKSYEAGTRGNSFGWSKEVFVNGDVVIEMFNDKSGGGTTRVQKIVFTEHNTPDYTRPVSNNIGTLCVDHNVPAGGAIGATFYQLAGKEPTYGKLVFDEVTELVAGEPYIFQSNTGSIALYYGETVQATPVEVNHMIGSYVDTEVEITEENKTSVMYIASNKLWDCSDYQTFTNQKLQVVANRAYIYDYNAIGTASPNPAPGRRRITVGKDGQNAATDVDLLNAAEAPVKMIINGQLFILRGEKMYDATGRMVK